MSTLLKRFLIHPFLMVSPEHSVAFIISSRVLQLQQLPGLVRQEELTTVVIILLQMHLCSVSGKVAITCYQET